MLFLFRITFTVIKIIVIYILYYSQLSMAIIKQTSVLHILTFHCTVFLIIYISNHFYRAIFESFDVVKHASFSAGMCADQKWLLAAHLVWVVEAKSKCFIGGTMCMWLQLFIRLYERSLRIHAPQFGFSVTLNVCWHFLKWSLKICWMSKGEGIRLICMLL